MSIKEEIRIVDKEYFLWSRIDHFANLRMFVVIDLSGTWARSNSVLLRSLTLPLCRLVSSMLKNRSICLLIPYQVAECLASLCFMVHTIPTRPIFWFTWYVCRSLSGMFQTLICVSDNIVIHLRSFQAIIAPFKLPFLPAYHYSVNDYLTFDTNYATLMALLYIVYYFLLDPVAAVSPVSQFFVLYLLTTLGIVHPSLDYYAAFRHSFLWKR